MHTTKRTPEFRDWFDRLRDERAKGRIAARIARMQHGNFGDVKAVGDKVFETRIDYGPGYRLYCARHGATVIILLCGGDKSTQKQDIEKAKALAVGL